MIYFINKEDNTILKTLKSSTYATEKYEAGEYTKLYGLYDADLHTSYVSDYKYANLEIIDGIVTEIIEEIEVVELTDEEKLDAIRIVRNSLLSDTDVYMVSDYPISDENLILMKTYRQELRDLTETIEDLDNFEYPTIPVL